MNDKLNSSAQLELKNVSFRYDESLPLLLDDVSVTFDEGDFDFIIGLNGAGKTTLLKLLIRRLSPLNGEIILEGKNISEYKSKELSKIIAYVPQDYGSVFPYTIFDFISGGRTPFMNYFGVPDKSDIEVIEKYLVMLGLEKLREKALTKVSGGELRRAMLARALIQQPKILILDEPNAHLDIEHQILMFELLEKLNSENKLTVITVSHDLNLTSMFSKNVILLNEGKAIKSTGSEFFKKENIKEYFKVNSEIVKHDKFTNVTILRN